MVPLSDVQGALRSFEVGANDHTPKFVGIACEMNFYKLTWDGHGPWGGNGFNALGTALLGVPNNLGRMIDKDEGQSSVRSPQRERPQQRFHARP